MSADLARSGRIEERLGPRARITKFEAPHSELRERELKASRSSQENIVKTCKKFRCTDVLTGWK